MTLRLALVVAALGAALLPFSPTFVEFRYSQWAFLAWQRFATRLSNLVPFALFDLLLAGALLWLGWTAVGCLRRFRGRPLRALADFLLRAAAGTALVYLAFLAAWGLNYRRVPLTSRLQFSTERVRPTSARELARSLALRANALRESLARHSGPSSGGRFVPGPSWDELPALLGPSFAGVQRQLAQVRPAMGGRPKPTLLTYYFERAGVDGMTDPFLLEILVNRSILPFERPFIVAHEWAHLAGYADEAEANFIGWLVCLQGPPEARYSGSLALLWQVLPALDDGERQAVIHQLSSGVRSDLRAVAARLARVTPVIREAGWRVYDRYLKANRVEQGIESYDAGLTLLLGTQFLPGWVPALRRP